MKNKIRRLLVPYAFTAAVWVVPISQHFFHKDMLYLLKKYVLCIYPSQLWFLWMLFGVFAASWPLWKIFSENVFAGAAAAIAFYCAGVAGVVGALAISAVLMKFKITRILIGEKQRGS